MGLEEAKESAVEAAKNAMAKDEKQKALAELMQSKANARAAQSRGAWRDDTVDDLSFSSDLFKPWSGEKSDGELFDMNAYWSAGKTKEQFPNSPLATSAWKEDGYNELYGSKLIGVIDNIAMSSGEGAIAIKNMGNIHDINYNDLLKSEDFKVYLSTINGEAGGQGHGSWIAVANVINNRVGIREWSRYKTQSDIIKNTGFDAYWKKTTQYERAYNILSSGKLNSKLTEMMHVIAPVYLGLTKDTTNGAVLYYSPKAQRFLAAKSQEYKLVPNWRWSELVRVHPTGVGKDDFAFYKYK